MPENMMNSSHKTNEGMPDENWMKVFGHCDKHPKYKAVKRPVSLCPKCWGIWMAMENEAKRLAQKDTD